MGQTGQARRFLGCCVYSTCHPLLSAAASVAQWDLATVDFGDQRTHDGGSLAAKGLEPLELLFQVIGGHLFHVHVREVTG